LLESKKSYVRYISHELRTPLNTAFLGLKLLSSELKASKCPKDVERYDTLCDVNLSCTAAVDILNDLLCYEKLQSGILELHKENILAAPFLNGCVSMFSAQARECGVTMTITGLAAPNRNDQTSQSLLPDDTIFADKFKMDQVIRNLISNALKFTPRGGAVTLKASFVTESRPKISSGFGGVSRGSLRVRKKSELLDIFRHYKSNSVGVCCDVNGLDLDTAIEPLHGRLVVEVTDTGAGISEGNQSRLFKEIVQFNPEKLQAGGGSGLGLWITRGIVDLHDGTISASSGGEGMGSSFCVEIPMLRWPPIIIPNGAGSCSGVGHAMMLLPSLSTASSESSQLAVNTAMSDSKIDSKIPFGSPKDCIPRSESSGSLSRSDTLTTLPVEGSGGVLLMTDCPVPILHALVVDDSSLNRKMLLKCLRAAGHVCTEAGDGLEAIEAVKKRIGHATGCHGKPFDAILMDFVMPNMDGPTATKEIRALGYTAPIFGVTGNGRMHLSCS
jgi:signal transduction histidine kinase/CheY-like chemotaxis protein